MIKKYKYITIALSIFYNFCFAQLNIEISSIPSNTPPNDKIFIAGSFNNWNPGLDEMVKQSNGNYKITINPSVGTVEYKYTRGNWSSVEGNASGVFLPNRKINYTGGVKNVSDQILSWEDKAAGGNNPSSTAASNVKIIKTDFYMPQFNRYRRIWIYLPKDYETTSKKYPVFYMHDGQNLFDKTTSFSGEWQIDESLNKLFDQGEKTCIVIGIDNGGADRIAEYTPYTNPKYGGGDGAKYIDFISNTLKPYVDQNYRTLTDRENTAIGGSSLGGLISFWAAMSKQETFGKALVFSPSFWWNKAIFDLVKTKGKEKNMKFYTIAGEQEGDPDMVPDATQMSKDLLSNGFSKNEVFFTTHSDGKHQEWYWAREFTAAYQWLFSNTTATKTLQNIDLQAFPNPASHFLNLKFGKYETLDAEIFSIDGKRLILQKVTSNDSINIETLGNGAYHLLLKNGIETIAQNKFIIQKK